MKQATASEGLKVEIEGLARQQKVEQKDLLLVAHCIRYVQPICHVDSDIYTLFSADCNLLIPHIFPDWLKAKRVLGKKRRDQKRLTRQSEWRDGHVRKA